MGTEMTLSALTLAPFAARGVALERHVPTTICRMRRPQRGPEPVSLSIGRLQTALKRMTRMGQRRMGQRRTGHTMSALVAALLAAVAGASCGDGSSHFVFRHTGSLGDVRSFVASTTDPDVIALAREELTRSADERTLYIQGRVAEGDGGLNEGWDWHFVPNEWELVDESVEICDADPEFIDATLLDWVEKIGRYCPRAARLDEER